MFKVIWQNEERDWILATVLPKLQEKVQCVKGERKLNFGNEITEIPVLPKLCPWMNCGNQVAKNGRKKEKELWQQSCRKWRKKENATSTIFSQQITGG